MAKKAPKMTLKQKVTAMKAMLRELHDVRYHEPDSDRHEYCAGCQHSPWNVPPHAEGCIVPRLVALLKRV